MVTPKSSDGAAPAIATVAIFSGRPDPEWPLPAAVIGELLAIWEALPPTALEPAVPPPLGYRGGMVCDGDRVWRVFRDVVTRIQNGRSEARRDVQRRFECRLLTSAPPGLVPPQVG